MQISMIQVQEYFNCHLQRRSWMQLPADTRQAAVKMAEEDIKLALGVNTLDTGDLLIFCAVCEQALFLALNEAGRPTRSSRHGALKSETIDGVGKREYYDTVPEKVTGTVSTHTGQLAPRSELFLSRLPGYGRSTVRLSRG